MGNLAVQVLKLVLILIQGFQVFHLFRLKLPAHYLLSVQGT